MYGHPNQMRHWDASHRVFHMDTRTEQLVIPISPSEAVRTTYRSAHYDRHSADATVPDFIERDLVRGSLEDDGEDDMRVRVVTNYNSYEAFIVCFISFYALCWLILRMNSRDVHEEDHEEL
jgi:hypothetical protein